jgi:hypothetical protein
MNDSWAGTMNGVRTEPRGNVEGQGIWEVENLRQLTLCYLSSSFVCFLSQH